MCKPLSSLIVLLTFCCQWVTAQSLVSDSISNLIKTAPDDTSKVMLIWRTGAKIIYQEPMTSIQYFRQGFDLAMRLNYTRGIEYCLTGTSFAYTVNAKYDSGLVYINRAIPYGIKAGDMRRIVLTYVNRADLHSNLFNYAAALKDCDTAIQFAEKMQGNADALGRIYGIMSGIYRDQKQYAAVELNIDKSIRAFERSNNRRMIAQMISDKGDLYNLLEQPDKAIPLLKEAIRIGDSLSDHENSATYYNSIAESYGKLKRFDEARKASRESIRLCEETGNIHQQANVYLNLCTIEIMVSNYKAAIEYGEKAYKICSAEADTLRLEVAAGSLAEAYDSIGNSAMAYKYLLISKQLNDSLMKKQFGEETNRLQTTFEVKEKDKEIQLLSAERELHKQRLAKQRILMIGAAILAFMALSGIWLLMNRNKLRQRMKELELRNRIAADLHDEVGSSLSSIHMLSQMASQKAGEGGQQDILSRMSTNAKETMDKMGDIVWMIKPGESESGSLKQRMERFGYEIGTSKNIEVNMQLEELDHLKLSIEQRRNIYLIFKEAVNNAAKYSGAQKIDIGSKLENRELILTIKDEGEGFDHAKTKKGNGLGNMANRAGELGGRLEISSAPGDGTTIILNMPL